MIPPIGPFDWASIGTAVANHLWQSTMFIGVAWLLTVALKKNQASIRHWIWLIASLKYLLPLSLLIGLGSHLSLKAPSAVAPPQWTVVKEISQPFAATELLQTESVTTPSTDTPLIPWLVVAGWFAGFSILVIYGMVRWRRLTTLLGKTHPLIEGREVDALRRVQLLRHSPSRVNLARSFSTIEPGVRGIIHPVLLFPVGIADRLDDEQLDAVVAHELSHIQRHDNLAAAIHMAVETIFWFHPLVWWIGSRLVDERERACDEEVLKLGNDPQIYAGAILKVCEFYMASSLTTVSGVTGSNLKKRIEAIMLNKIGLNLSFAAKSFLATIGIGLICVPILLGSLQDAQSKVPIATPVSFEVASIKVDNSGPDANKGLTRNPQGGRFTAENLSLKELIEYAYSVGNQGLLSDSQISGGPKWMDSERYDVIAKADDPSTSGAQAKLMLQALLTDRFKLKFHWQTKEVSGYRLVVAKNGPRIKESAVDQAPLSRAFLTGPLMELAGQKMPIDRLAEMLAARLNRPVTNETGLTALYDYNLTWAPGENEFEFGTGTPARSSLDTVGPSLTTALEEQAGLKLETQKVLSNRFLVIDSAEKLTANEAAADAPKQLEASAAKSGLGGPSSLQSLTSSGSTLAQLPARLSPSFELASIKPVSPGGRGGGGGLPCGNTPFRIDPQQLSVDGATVCGLIRWAYGLGMPPFASTADRLSGLPEWARSDRFAIQALMPKGSSDAHLLMQALLAERFKLVLRRETRKTPIYALTVAKDGLKLQWDGNRQSGEGGRRAAEGSCIDPETLSDPRLAEKPLCGLGINGRGPIQLNVRGKGLDQVSDVLSLILDRIVINKTGIDGLFDILVRFAADEHTQLPADISPPSSSNSEPDLPSLFTALQEKLGMRLEATTGPVEVFVIERVERPKTD